MKKTILFATLALFIGAAPVANSGESYGDIVKSAKAEMKKAKKMSYLWRDTGKILKKAEKAKGNGNMKKAVKLAKKARKQAMLAQKQAKDQANPRVRYPSM